MAHAPQIRIPATYLRGGTSKGVFFRLQDLPAAAQVPGAARDALLLRVIGSPDPYGKQIDGMGGATSSTSKIVIVKRSGRADSDVEYTFGQVAIDRAAIDYSGNCGNLTTAVGAFGSIVSAYAETCERPRSSSVSTSLFSSGKKPLLMKPGKATWWTWYVFPKRVSISISRFVGCQSPTAAARNSAYREASSTTSRKTSPGWTRRPSSRDRMGNRGIGMDEKRRARPMR